MLCKLDSTTKGVSCRRRHKDQIYMPAKARFQVNAKVGIPRKTVYIGTYSCPLEAANAWKEYMIGYWLSDMGIYEISLIRKKLKLFE